MTTANEAAVRAIDEADPAALVAALATMSDRERRSLNTPLREHLRRRHRLDPAIRDWPEHLRTVDLVLEFGTCEVRNVGWGWWRLSRDPLTRAQQLEHATDVIASRPSSVHRTLARAVCSADGGQAQAWPVLRALQDRGVLAAEVDDDDWAVGVVRGVGNVLTADPDGDWRNPPADMLVRALSDDPAIRPHVLHALGHGPALDAMQDTWAVWVATAVEARALPRATVLTTVFRAQDGDVRPTTAQLLCRVLDALAPDRDELSRHEPELVRILADGHPTAQRHAAAHLRDLARLDRLIDPAAVAHATVGPLTGPQKAAAVTALRLLDALDADGHQIALAATAGFSHAHEDVQARALDLVERLVGAAPPPEIRDEALLHLEVVAPAHRGRVADLAGVGDLDGPAPSVTVPDLAGLTTSVATLPPDLTRLLDLHGVLTAAEGDRPPAPARFPPAAVPPRAEVTPVTDVLELGELLGFLLGGSATPVDLERAIDGLARHDARAAPATVTSTVLRLCRAALQEGGGGMIGFLVAQAAQAWASQTRPGRLEYLSAVTVPRALGRLRGRRSGVGRLLHDVVIPPPATHDHYARPDGGASVAGLVGVVQARLFEAVTITQSTPRPTLALPTDTTGWIDTATFAERVRQLDAADQRPGRFEAVAALLRLRNPRALRGALPTGGATRAIAAAIDGDTRADPALNRALDRTTELGNLRLAAPERRPGLVRTTPWFEADEVPVWRRDDPLGQLLHEITEQESRHAASWWDTSRNVMPEADRLAVGWAPHAVPAHAHLLAATATRLVLVDPDADRSSSAIDELLAHAADPDVALEHPWHVLLAVTLGAGNRVAGIAAADVVAAAAEDGRLDPAELGGRLAWLHAASVGKSNRVADRLRPIAEASPVVAAAVRRALQAWVAAVTGLPRDLHHLLGLLEATCAACGAGVDDPAARAVLEAASTGGSKRATAARRLLALPSVPPSFEPATTAAAHVGRAERWATAWPD